MQFICHRHLSFHNLLYLNIYLFFSLWIRFKLLDITFFFQSNKRKERISLSHKHLCVCILPYFSSQTRTRQSSAKLNSQVPSNLNRRDWAHFKSLRQTCGVISQWDSQQGTRVVQQVDTQPTMIPTPNYLLFSWWSLLNDLPKLFKAQISSSKH